MSVELATRDNVTELARPTSGLALSFAEMTLRVAQLDQFYREVMQEGTDYGKIPGTDKPTLYQPGAQMLDQIFGYAPKFEVMVSSVLDWQRPIPFFHYVVMCRLVSRRTSEVVAEGIGSCNSFEDKYRWRNAKRVCPDCKAETIIKGKQEYGGGWLCFKKNGGCGTKFRDGEAIIEDQQVGRVENEDTASLENTISKMAQKRAHIAATLNATGASRIFTQDIEDLPQFQSALVVEGRSEPRNLPSNSLCTHAPAHANTCHACATCYVLGPGYERHVCTPIDRAQKRASDQEQSPVSHAADAETRARFEANWRKGVARAVACGVAPDGKPPADATKGALNIAQRELVEAIKAREALNAALLERVGLVREAGGTFQDIDTAKLTDAEVHKGIADLDAMLAPPESDDSDEAF